MLQAPTTDFFFEQTGQKAEDFDADEISNIEVLLAQSTDALWAYTGLSKHPADERFARIVDRAMVQLAQWLLSTQDNQEAINSPFSSERIGSYSYSKMQQAEAGQSGLFWLDMLFQVMRTVQEEALFASSSEWVFNPRGLSYEESEREESWLYMFTDPAIGGW